MPSNTRFRVLYVDNDDDACEMVSLLLNWRQIEVTCAQSATDAWLKIKAKHFDLLMLDVWLPEVDGFELCRQVRTFDSHTPIVFYSGAAFDADKQKGLAAGADAYLVKPDIEGLTETILGLIAKDAADDVAPSWAGNHSYPAENRLSAQFFNLKTASD